MTKLVYAVQEDCENWIYTDFEEAAQEYLDWLEDLMVGTGEITIYCGEARHPDVGNFASISDLLNESLCDDFGEAVCDWLSYVDTDALDKYMEESLKSWLTDNNCMPTFYYVDNIKPLKVKVICQGEENYEFELLEEYYQ